MTHFSSVGSTLAREQAEAVFRGKAIENELNRAAQAVTLEIEEARRAGAANGNLESVNNLQEIVDAFYRDSVEPREGETTNNCALFKALTRKVASLAKQVSVMAGGETKFADKYFQSGNCAAFENCFKEARELCTVNALRGLEKFRAGLSFLNFFPVCEAPDFEEFRDECRQAWYGTIS